MLGGIVFEETCSSIYMIIACLGIFLVPFFIGIAEATGGRQLQYSKFSKIGSKQMKCSSKIGMLIFYMPALLTAASSFILLPNIGIRVWMLKSAITIHFLKRVLEVLFLHKFSGSIGIETLLIVSSFYFTSAAGMIYVQSITQTLPEPSINLIYIGLAAFPVGICGNFYHHYLLSKLRNGQQKGYKIPTGGLFNKVICPHYLFEIITFLAMACISQSLFSFSCAFGSAFYLVGRSYTTRKWYVSKFENFPNKIKSLIPYIF